MRVLVTFCSQTYTPALSAAVVDLSTGDIAWIPLGESIGGIGLTGVTVTPWSILLADQSADDGVVTSVDASMRASGRSALDGSRDIHGLFYDAGTLFVASSGTDSINAYDVDSNGVTGPRIVWGSGAGRDVHHVNSVTVHDGRLVATMFGTCTTSWADARDGIVFDLQTDEPIREGLHHPHSIRSDAGRLFFLTSGDGCLHRLDDSGSRAYEGLPGYVRGLAVAGDVAVIGSSGRRLVSRSQGTLNTGVADSAEEARSSVFVVELDSGAIRNQVDLSAYGREIFDVCLLPDEYGSPSSSRPALEERALALETAVTEQDFARSALEHELELLRASLSQAGEELDAHRAEQDRATARLDAQLRRRSVRLAIRIADVARLLLGRRTRE